MIKLFSYKPAAGKGKMEIVTPGSKSLALLAMDILADYWGDAVVEKKDDFLMNDNGDWLLLVEAA